MTGAVFYVAVKKIKIKMSDLFRCSGRTVLLQKKWLPSDMGVGCQIRGWVPRSSDQGAELPVRRPTSRAQHLMPQHLNCEPSGGNNLETGRTYRFKATTSVGLPHGWASGFSLMMVRLLRLSKLQNRSRRYVD